MDLKKMEVKKMGASEILDTTVVDKNRERWKAVEELVPIIADALTDEDEDVRGAAFQSLMAMGDIALSILPKLRDIMRDLQSGNLTSKNKIQLLALSGHLVRLQKNEITAAGGLAAVLGVKEPPQA